MKRLLVTGFLFVATIFIVSSCQKDLSQEDNSNTATFSLLDDSANCYGSTVYGNYYDGIRVGITNYVAVEVNVKSTGSYTITTDSVNGYYFADTGFFSKIGLDTLLLKAYGTPILVLTNQFSLPDSACSFLVPVEDSTGTGLGGVDTSGTGGGGTVSGDYSASYVDSVPAGNDSWHFYDSTNGYKTYGGSITLGQLATNTDNTSTFQFQGFVSGNTNLSFTFSLTFPTATPQTGSYQVDGITTTLFLTNISTLAFDYNADASTSNETNDPSYVNITSYDAANKRIAGSFRCWAADANGNPALIKGSFNSSIQ